MNKIIKVGKIPGKLVQIALEDNVSYTAKQVFDLANIEIDENYTINDGSTKIGLNDIVQGSILVASAKIKGNSGRIVKVGKIPGKLVQIALEDNVSYTAKQVFDLANIEIDENYTINDGSTKIGLNDVVNGSILVASAKIKGNSSLYALKDYIDSNDILDIPQDMINGTFSLLESNSDNVTLEDTTTKELFIIQSCIFNKLFEEVTYATCSNNHQQENTTQNHQSNFKENDTFKKFISFKIHSLEDEINEYNLKISNTREQIEYLKSLLSN